MTLYTLADCAARIEAAGRLLSTARRILFITGAGLSADSGLPTYRGVGGLYEGALTDVGLPIEQALSGAMFERRPDITWRYLSQIEASCRDARPNAGHYAIARLEAMHGAVTVLTQNVDGFHLMAGSHDVIEMHGTLRRLRCVDCGRCRQVDNYAGLQIPPDCPHCGGVLRPDVVLFGENLPDQAVHRFEQVLAAGPDMIFSVGTGSSFPYIAGPMLWAIEQGIPTIEINPGHTPISERVMFRFRLRAAEVLPALLDAAGYSLDRGTD
ncbi:MAG TPA: NAD-dependent deacylase [Zoogloea sp.]|jgi:NAD-dependent deacetylase|uniref:SIR2 family NAD-dependent protein deacylase n=1 Tax=Zoogloea sp. TaxID=49181 RepID=UPI0011D6C870|nr:NAD-dependent deacylase [Zoogloea sp.]TXI46746.1 MAG: NAD-dependent deacylase [Lysobacter sp.]MBP8265243.1 NAD-dependent deacylase [Zoogloea sp.]HOB44793.1 NAD-dependent deacylase [Zoogloea sp.]HQA09172.1 NAD-dependent deacylase [Zoogloea sp.]HQE40884.1 NAD-dependent deacylase [Zoogloea sp.]